MFQECKHKDRLMYAITNMEKEPDLFYEALENFRKYGAATASDTQAGGQHYKAKIIQPWDFIAANGLDYFEGNIVKYVSRWRDKGGLDDLRKARRYLDKLIEKATTRDPLPEGRGGGQRIERRPWRGQI